MAKPILMRKRAKLVAIAFFFLALIIMIVTKSWWPAMMLALGIPLAIWQYLQGRHFDMMMSLFVFGGAFVTVAFQIQWEILLPVLFSIGGLYILVREWMESKNRKEEEFDLDQRSTKKDKDKDQ